MHHRKLSISELIAFYRKERLVHDDLTELELSHLGPPESCRIDETYTLTTIYGVFNHLGELVGFCLIPSYDKTIAQSLYVARVHRTRGYASYMLNALKITLLCCLTDNTNAIRLYESLGFQKKSITQHSIRFERKLS